MKNILDKIKDKPLYLAIFLGSIHFLIALVLFLIFVIAAILAPGLEALAERHTYYPFIAFSIPFVIMIPFVVMAYSINKLGIGKSSIISLATSVQAPLIVYAKNELIFDSLNIDFADFLVFHFTAVVSYLLTLLITRKFSYILSAFIIIIFYGSINLASLTAINQINIGVKDSRENQLVESLSNKTIYFPSYIPNNYIFDFVLINQQQNDEPIIYTKLTNKSGKQISIQSEPESKLNKSTKNINPPRQCSITKSFSAFNLYGADSSKPAVHKNQCIVHKTANGRIFYEEKPEVGAHETFMVFIDNSIVFINFEDRHYGDNYLNELSKLIDGLEKRFISDIEQSKLNIWLDFQ